MTQAQSPASQNGADPQKVPAFGYDPNEDRGTAVGFGDGNPMDQFLKPGETLHEIILKSRLPYRRLEAVLGSVEKAIESEDYPTFSELMMVLVGSAAAEGYAREEAIFVARGATVAGGLGNPDKRRGLLGFTNPFGRNSKRKDPVQQ